MVKITGATAFTAVYKIVETDIYLSPPVPESGIVLLTIYTNEHRTAREETKGNEADEK